MSFLESRVIWLTIKQVGADNAQKDRYLRYKKRSTLNCSTFVHMPHNVIWHPRSRKQFKLLLSHKIIKKWNSSYLWSLGRDHIVFRMSLFVKLSDGKWIRLRSSVGDNLNFMNTCSSSCCTWQVHLITQCYQGIRVFCFIPMT